ncbi:MAG: hypothetical protein LBQ54_10960 [Planctomycetaceae bacterium]|jgi:hypothetical protein|nr:hypothetical protein [Planctomycetaceae bacterium]
MPPVKSLVPNLCNGNVFDEYLHASGNRNFYERFQKGENVKAGWITPTDIEQERIVE